MESSHPFTCNTCQVAFRSSELQRAHMQTDWHRYNLKRRVASLPPLSSEIFTEKVLANKADAAATAAKATFEKHCPACQKSYYSDNAFQDHLRSQRHRANVSRKARFPPQQKGGDETASVVSSTFSLGAPARSLSGVEGGVDDDQLSKVVEDMRQTTIEGSEDDGNKSNAGESNASDTKSVTTTAPPTSCLFCNYVSPTFNLNIAHMSRFHGLFIPESEYLTDLGGLISYLSTKINEFHECLYCGKSKPTAIGVQTHMRDLGHCMIAFESEEEMIEIGQFYDFRSTYPDAEDHAKAEEDDMDTDTAASKLGARRTKDAAEREDGDDEGWETDSTLSSVPSDEITAVPIADFSHRYATLSKHRHHSHADPRPHHGRDGWHSHAHPTPHAVYHDDVELHLPNGKSVGHRSMKVYWNQNLRGHPSPSERQAKLLANGPAEEDDDVDMEDASAEVDGTRERGRGRQLTKRGNGELGMTGVADSKKREVRKAELRAAQTENKARTRQQWGNEKRKNHQKHFRDPLLQ